MKKLISLVLALAMVALCGLAFATEEPATPNYSITVNGTANETYTAYRLFDLSVDDPLNPGAYRYTVNSAFASFANTDAFKAVYTVDAQGYVTSTTTSTTTWSATSALSQVADAAAKFAADNSITAAGSVTIAAGATSGTINLTTGGYYVVSSSLGSRAMLDTTPSNPAVTINEKNEGDTIDKQVKEDSTEAYGDSNDAQVGDTVEFKSVATIAARSINVKIHDTMDSGLTLNASSIHVYTDAALETEYTSATVRAGTGDSAPDSGDTFTIDIPDTFAASATASQTLYIVYTAEINAAAVVTGDDGTAIVDQNNRTKVSYGDHTNSTEDHTTTTTHKFMVYKHATGQNANLADAVFQVLKGTTVVNLIKINDTNYRVADNTETGTAASHANSGEIATIAAGSLVSDFVTVADSDITIWGVDADDDYHLHEVQAPKGYNALANNVDVTVAAANNTRVDVANSTGTELPSTGGIGTTIFYIVGGMLLVGAAIVLVARRKASEN
jgi:LPXTG-motif cell wall-anchored protein